MKKFRLAILGVAAVLSVANYALTPLYIGVVVVLGWRAYVAFVPLAGLLAWLLIYIDGDTDATLAEFVERKIKRKSVKNFLLSLFKIKFVAIAFSTLFLGPYITPLLVNLCIKGSKRVYFWAILLNMLSVALWVFIYLGGADLIGSIWGLHWLLKN